MKIEISLTKRQAEAALKSDGLHITYGNFAATPSKVLAEASERILNAIQAAHNESIDQKDQP